MLNLYLLESMISVEYDMYSSLVVADYSKEDAVQRAKLYTNNDDSEKQWDINATYDIGIASDYFDEATVVISSFNSGW